MSEWGIINGNPIIFQMGSSPKWDIGHVTVTRHGEHITSFTLHDFVLTLVPTYHFETPRSHHSKYKTHLETDMIEKEIMLIRSGGVRKLAGGPRYWWWYWWELVRNGEITAFFACLSKLPGPRRSRRCSVPQGGLSFPHPKPAIKKIEQNLNFFTFPCL